MATALVRHPAVAGRFYPSDPEALRKEVDTYLAQRPSRKATGALGCIAPHAGYMYSGHVAGAVFAGLEVPELCVVMCPNHTGMGRPLAIMSDGSLGNSARLCAHRQRFCDQSQAALLASSRRFRRAPLRARHRS